MNFLGSKNIPTHPSPARVKALACVLIVMAALAVHAQQPVQPVPGPAVPPTVQPQAQPGAAGVARPALKVASAPKVNGKATTSPLWRELTSTQQQSLIPLASKWDILNETQKRKWIALSRNFPRMSGPEQAKLHSRMAEWVTLSPQQRTLARLNFGETQQISPDDKKAKWEAYQALPPEEKKKLAAGAAAKTPTTAAAVKPVGPDKLAVIRKSRPLADAKTPRIAAAPDQVDPNTLLPQQQPASAPTPVAN